jgi:alkyl hydroperoxide reductase subunit AhpF
MMRILWICVGLLLSPLLARADETYDVVVYGGSAGGISAAIQTARLGKSV